jgi:hypothetical protein
MRQRNHDHPTHDLALVAAHAAGDLPESDRIPVVELLASCPDCADLHRDLLDIAAATRSLPAPLARARDFQLEPGAAERLRRGSWLRRLLQPFGAAGSSARPIATAFTTLGIAGLLVATALSGFGGLAGGNSASAPERDSSTGAAVPAPAATAAPAAAPSVPQPQAGAPSAYPADVALGQHASGAPNATAATVKAGASGSPERALTAFGGPVASVAGAADGSSVSGPLLVATPPNLLVLGSVALLAIGLALFALWFAGRRVR